MKLSMYRRTAIAVLVSFAATIAILAPLPASAQQQQIPLVVAVLDVNLILRESSAAKAVRAQIDKQRDTYQAALVTQENKLRDADQKLSQDRASLSQEEFLKRRDELGKQIEQLRVDSDKRKQALEKAFNSGMQQVTQSLGQVLSEIAKQRGLTLVLNKAMVPLSANDLDITQEALKMLNARLPNVAVPASQ
ncbi:MAG: OmpH family outer membrane protein [Dongiaceae bacterium]